MEARRASPLSLVSVAATTQALPVRDALALGAAGAGASRRPAQPGGMKRATLSAALMQRVGDDDDDNAAGAASAAAAASAADAPPPAGTRAEARLVYYVGVYLGFCLLVSWNCVLNAVPWFTALYGGSTNISFYLSAAYVYPQLPVLLLVTLFGDRVSCTARVVGSMGAMAALMAALPLLAPRGMWWALGVMFLNGLATAVLQPSMIGFTSQFPPELNQGNMLGQGLSGVATCAANVVVQAALANQQDLAARVYFAVSAGFIAVGLGAYLYILRLPYVRHYTAKAAGGGGGSGAGGDSSEEEGEELGSSGAGAEAGRGGRGANAGAGAPNDESEEAGGLVPHHPHHAVPLLSRLSVLRKVATQAAAVWLVFVVTFTVFPGVAPFSVPFRHGLGSLTMNNDWWGIVLLTVFNVFDTVGRFLPSQAILLRGRGVLLAAAVRALTIPAFIGAAAGWAAWMGDAYTLALMAVFATTNGYFASLAMMQGPAGVPPREREAAGFVCSLFLQFGIFTGSQVALGVQRLL